MNLPPPFVIFTDTEIERYRNSTFWTKEPETLHWIESFDKNDVFYDIGANIGIYSFYAAYLYPEMKIYAFEPMESNYITLNRLRKLNELNNVLPLRYAMSNWVGMGRLNIPDMTSGATGSKITINKKDRTVFVRSIDSLQGTLDIPDHVKIDIDGDEYKVLDGMKDTIKKIKSILVEVSSKSKFVIIEKMIKSGFTMLNEFNEYIPHSRVRRLSEQIDAENIVFTRVGL